MAENEGRGLDFRAPGGESPREVQARIRPLLAEIGRDGRDRLAVTHKARDPGDLCSGDGLADAGRAAAAPWRISPCTSTPWPRTARPRSGSSTCRWRIKLETRGPVLRPASAGHRPSAPRRRDRPGDRGGGPRPAPSSPAGRRCRDSTRAARADPAAAGCGGRCAFLARSSTRTGGRSTMSGATGAARCCWPPSRSSTRISSWSRSSPSAARQFAFELLPLLEAAAGARGLPTAVSLRDILVGQEQARAHRRDRRRGPPAVRPGAGAWRPAAGAARGHLSGRGARSPIACAIPAMSSSAAGDRRRRRRTARRFWSPPAAARSAHRCCAPPWPPGRPPRSPTRPGG